MIHCDGYPISNGSADGVHPHCFTQATIIIVNMVHDHVPHNNTTCISEPLVKALRLIFLLAYVRVIASLR